MCLILSMISAACSVAAVLLFLLWVMPVMEALDPRKPPDGGG